ncbi:MAG: AAA family ATPase [Thermodesulfobacteriota bacterium]
MSRYCGKKDSAGTLAAAEHWRQKCLLEDGSVLTEKSLWKQENFEEIDKHVVNQPNEGEGNFFEKLEAQLISTKPEIKQLTAEILWVMFLCPSNISPGKKREGFQTIWNWSEESYPQDTKWLKNDYLSGVGSAGTGYNTNRWRELSFFIRVMIAIKKLSKSELSKLLGDGWLFAQWMQEIPECDARQFRHMLLFMLFPDSFERIFGGKDRRKILASFTGKTNSQISALKSAEIDRELASIRQQQEHTYGLSEMDFYEPPLRDLWGEARNVSWLLTWNPNVWKWERLPEDRAATREGKTVTMKWTCLNQNAAVGDNAYLMRLGTSPKGIIAFGNIVTAPYKDSHYNEDKADAGQTSWYVDVAFSRIQDPLKNDPYITNEDLNKITVDNQAWSPPASGIEIKHRSAGILKKLWEKAVGSTIQPVDEKSTPGISEPLNLILYGPPGTGKTYQLRKFMERYTGKKQKIGREAWLIQQLMDLRWFDAIFAALYDIGTKGKVTDIVNHEFIRLKARALGRQRNVAQTVWGTLQAHSREDSQTVQYKNRRAPRVFDKTQDSIWALTDDWQEECSEQVELAKTLRQGPKEASAIQRYEFVTFHQAYSYEDFVEGIRPVHDEEAGEFSYLVVPGVFQRIAQKAKADPEQKYAIFIDEINRGNIAKIFGELITLIEADKRAVYAENGEKLAGMELTLPYSGRMFGVPKNLDVYGTMNTADRSIALLDTALRRRFTFKELMPDVGVISGSSGDGYIEDGDGGTINLRAMLDAMNRRIRFLLNRDMTLGHAYLTNVRDFAGLQNVLLNQIIPLLQEYFYGDWHRIQLVFRDVGPAGEKLEPQIICHQPMNEKEILGFDHEDYEDLIEYRVAPREEIIPDSVRKIFEGGA